MVDVRNDRIHDGILVPDQNGIWPFTVERCGVERPDPGQYKVVQAFQTTSFRVVKDTYLQRLRMATVTDHFPVYAYFGIIKTISK